MIIDWTCPLIPWFWMIFNHLWCLRVLNWMEHWIAIAFNAFHTPNFEFQKPWPSSTFLEPFLQVLRGGWNGLPGRVEDMYSPGLLGPGIGTNSHCLTTATMDTSYERTPEDGAFVRQSAWNSKHHVAQVAPKRPGPSCQEMKFGEQEIDLLLTSQNGVEVFLRDATEISTSETPVPGYIYANCLRQIWHSCDFWLENAKQSSNPKLLSSRHTVTVKATVDHGVLWRSSECNSPNGWTFPNMIQTWFKPSFKHGKHESNFLIPSYKPNFCFKNPKIGLTRLWHSLVWPWGIWHTPQVKEMTSCHPLKSDKTNVFHLMTSIVNSKNQDIR